MTTYRIPRTATTWAVGPPCLDTQCIRLIHAENGTGQAQHRPHLMELRGPFLGKWHTVESGDEHGADLDAVQKD